MFTYFFFKYWYLTIWCIWNLNSRPLNAITIQCLFMIQIASQKGFLFLFQKILFVLMSVCLLVCISYTCRCPQRPEERVMCSGNGAKIGDQCGFWQLNLGPLKEQQVLLTSEYLSSSQIVF